METEGRKLRYYEKEFKLEAVLQIVEKGRGVTEVAKGLGIPAGSLYTWIKKYKAENQSAFPGKGNLTPEAEELRKLRRELAGVTEERDILKKAVAIFSKIPNRNTNS